MTASTLPLPKPGPSQRIVPLAITGEKTGTQSIVGSREGTTPTKARGISGPKVSLWHLSNKSLEGEWEGR